MSHAVAADGTQGGVAGDDLTIAGGGGVALIGGHHIGGEEAAQTGQTAHKGGGYALAIVVGAGCSAIEAEPCTDLTDEERVEAMLADIDIDFRFNSQRGASDIYVNGDLVEGKIRTIEVSNCVSAVSSIAAVRHKLVAMQQQMGRRGGVVMDGRDIGTVVFPDAELKIYMTADAMVRAERRFKELTATGDKVTLEEVYENVVSRDKADMSRAISPLRKADDALVLDNSNMSVEEQMAWFDAQFERVVGM